MQESPSIAAVATLIGDPARAGMLTALMDGRALTVSELAGAAGVGLPTASAHLARLETAGLTVVERQGRHRYVRLSGPDVVRTLEGLMSLAQRTGATRVRTGPRDAALRQARVCYGHLAGETGVALMRALEEGGQIAGGPAPKVTEAGRAFFAGLGVDLAALERKRRPVCRTCLDWSERRAHLGGALGARLLEVILAKGWARRAEGRAVAFTPQGAQAFAAAFPGLLAPGGTG